MAGASTLSPDGLALALIWMPLNCPNIGPAFAELEQMGFKNVKALYLEENFGADWVAKGYPAVQGR